MKITLGENIRSLRNREKITQEQLAEALGVSPQAVSRWENSAAFPDISALPVIANFFNVSVDCLLGADTAHKQRDINKAIEADEILRSEGRTRESVEFLREKVREYPSCSEILHRLACSLYSLYHQSGERFSEEEVKSMAGEAVEMCGRALKYSSDQCFESRCRQTMILNLIQLGERGRARETADTLPSLWCSREMVYPNTLTGREALKEYQENLLLLIDALSITMGRIRSCGNYTGAQIAELAEARERMILMLAGDNPCWLNERLFDLALTRAKIYCRSGDNKKLFGVLPKLLKYARDYEERRNGGKYKVFWLSECTDGAGMPVRHSSESLYDRLRAFIDKHGLKEKLAGDERFGTVSEALDMLCRPEVF